MVDFTVLVLKGCYATSVSVTLDALAAAGRLADRAGAAPPRWRVCSADGGAVRLSSGMTVATRRLPARGQPEGSVWVLPGLGVNQQADLEARLRAPDVAVVAGAVARHVAAGGRVAASCTAVFLLHLAGVLAGRRVTTAWWLAPYLQRLAPGCRVDADRMVCADGPILTGGAAFAQGDLMLHALRSHGGSKLSDWVSRMLLIDGRSAQAPFIVPELLANGDQLVNQLLARVEAALPGSLSVAALAEGCCMSVRTLARHVHRATGRSPLALVQSVRVQKARALLESSQMTVEQVAEAVGYRDATTLRRLIKKVTGANPGQYRPAASTP